MAKSEVKDFIGLAQGEMTFGDYFNNHIGPEMPEEALRMFIESVKRGKIPQAVPRHFRQRFFRNVSVFESFLDTKVIRVSPLDFQDPEHYKWPNFKFVQRRGRVKPYLRVTLHPDILIDLIPTDLEPLQVFRDRAEFHLTRTIMGTMDYYTRLNRIAATQKAT